MRFCIVSQNVIKGDGQGRANYEIVKEAIRRGHHFTLIASRVADDLLESDQVTWVNIAVKHLPSILLRDLVFSWKSTQWLKAHEEELDVVQVYGCVTAFPGDINTVQFLHNGWLRSPVHTSRQRKDLLGTYQWLYTSLNANWEKRALNQAKVVIAVSKRVEQELLSVGVSKDTIRVIFNGVDVQEFVPGRTERKRWSLPEGVPMALFVGDIRSNRKNLETVLSAMAAVPDLHLTVVGSTEGSPYMERAQTLGIGDRVHFLGYRLDVAEIMKAVDFFVFPSRYEPFGMVVTEAMATGLPVVTCATTGASEVITPAAGIVLPESEDIEALSTALATMAEDPERRQQMGKVGREIVEQHSWASKAQQYIDLFEELGKSPQPVPA
ncbi:MAG: glycosyltransferase family 4 protein [Cyanobacteria bacterium P01_D01_bin.1]